jgi:hypothetical protein
MPPDGTGKHDPLVALSTLLRAALDLTVDLARDHHLPRLLKVFARLPAADRGPLVAKLESEVAARQRSMETGDGLVGPPNPLASLYVRIYENGRPLPGVSRDTMLRSTIQAAALMGAFTAARRCEVEEAMLAGMSALEPADAQALARHHEDLLALAAWCERAEGERCAEEVG